MSPKLLAFYGGTLVLVVVLFQVVTSYGERYLKPASNINGRYVSTSAYPGCPEASRLLIDIQQSGIYLTGAIAVETGDRLNAFPAAAQPQSDSMPGRWQNQRLTLAGKTAVLATCETQPASAQRVEIVGTIEPQAAKNSSNPAGMVLEAEIISGARKPWHLVAQQQAMPKKDLSKH
jgi:hypothetical protein